MIIWYATEMFKHIVVHMASETLVNTGSGNGLLPDGTKPLTVQMLIYYQWDSLVFIPG